jgi:heterotetrameric sarcosine oxidase gamma subunit
MSDVATTSNWAPRGAWAGILSSGHHGAVGQAGVSVTAWDAPGIASLIVGDGNEAALASIARERFGLELPMTPQVSASDTHALVWTGPGQWLLVAQGRAGFAGDMQALADVAAVAEQSDGRAGLRLSGPRVRDALAKGCMIDLHSSAFPIGSTALTSIAHIGVHLWRAEDGPDGAVFEIMVARSMAGSFWSWLSGSAAEFGCKILAAKGCDAGRG